MWPFDRKKVRRELSPWEEWIGMWQDRSGLHFNLEPTSEKNVNRKATDGYWLMHKQDILVVISGDNASIAKQLLEAIPLVDERYERNALSLLPASIEHVDAILLGYECYRLQVEGLELWVWLRSDIYDSTAKRSLQVNELFSYILFYHLMVPRFKEQDKSLSWHISALKDVGKWHQKEDWALLQVVVQLKNPAITFEFWLSWPQKGDTQGFWRNVMKRFSYHTARIWEEARVEIIYKEITQRMFLQDCLGVQGEVRYKEPYRLPVLLLFSKQKMHTLAHELYPVRHASFWGAYHQLQLDLWKKNHEVIERMALYGGLYERERMPSVADFLLFLPENEQDKILQNFLGIIYSEKVRAIFCYQVSLDSSDVRWVTSDLFEHNLLARLPRNIADDWSHLDVSNDMEQWQQLNEEVLCTLSKRVNDGQIALSPLTQRRLIRWVSTPYQERYAHKFEEKYRYFSAQWNLMPTSHKNQLVSKIHNGQWLPILLLKPQFLKEIEHHVSQRRLALIKEELIYFHDGLGEPYEEAVRVLQQIADVKY